MSGSLEPNFLFAGCCIAIGIAVEIEVVHWPSQIHYQDANNVKNLYDADTGSFLGAPNRVNKLLENPDFINGIKKGLRFLGED